mmetsp:Transcript_32299/g.86511  ORF Transcript_32299/g.86511 Transcript_32299/m.86511 type:complete len:242 (-) Transcript_32299:810-1535(-)
MPSNPSTACCPTWGPRISPRLSAMVAALPRRDRSNNSGCNSRYTLTNDRTAVFTPFFLCFLKPARSASSSSVKRFTVRPQTWAMVFRPTSMTSGVWESVTKFFITCTTTGFNSSSGTCLCDDSTRHARILVTSFCVGTKYRMRSGYMFGTNRSWRPMSRAARCITSKRKRKGSPLLEMRCTSLSANVWGSWIKSIATKLTAVLASFLLCFPIAFFAAFFARFTRFSLLPVFFACAMPVRAS